MKPHLLIITFFGAITLTYSQTNKSAKQILVEHENKYGSEPNAEVYEEQSKSDEERYDETLNSMDESSNSTFQSKVEEKNKPYVLPGESELGPRDLNKVAESRRKAHNYKIARNIIIAVLIIGLLWYGVKYFEGKNR